METRNDEKGKRFEFLIRRIDDSLKDGYYVEAMAITYALFEERTYRILDRLNIPYKNKEKLHDCLVKLEFAINNRSISVTTKNTGLDELIDSLDNDLLKSNLIQDIQNWRDKRNQVIHDMAKMTIDYSSLKSTSEEGRKLFGEYTAIIMRIKKKIDK